RDTAGPKPKGSAKRLRYSLKLESLGQPCVAIIKADATRNNNSATSTKYILVENIRRFMIFIPYVLLLFPKLLRVLPRSMQVLKHIYYHSLVFGISHTEPHFATF